MHFVHRELEPGNPKGDSRSEKMNVWSTRVIANDQREARLRWETTQVGNLWRASLHVMPKPGHLRQDWEETVTYTGGIFGTKRNAKEDACCLLMQAQQQAGRLPDLLPPLDKRQPPLAKGRWRNRLPAAAPSRQDPRSLGR